MRSLICKAKYAIEKLLKIFQVVGYTFFILRKLAIKKFCTNTKEYKKLN